MTDLGGSHVATRIYRLDILSRSVMFTLLFTFSVPAKIISIKLNLNVNSRSIYFVSNLISLRVKSSLHNW